MIAMVVMVIGIGFMSMLIGAAAERFVSQEVAEAEETLATEVADSEADVLREIQEISERLRHLEAGVRQLQDDLAETFVRSVRDKMGTKFALRPAC